MDVYSRPELLCLSELDYFVSIPLFILSKLYNFPETLPFPNGVSDVFQIFGNGEGRVVYNTISLSSHTMVEPNSHFNLQ